MDTSTFTVRLVSAYRLLEGSPDKAAAAFDELATAELPALEPNGPNDQFVVDLLSDDGTFASQPVLKGQVLYLPDSWRTVAPRMVRRQLETLALHAACRGADAAPEQLKRIAQRQLAHLSPQAGIDVSLHLAALARLAETDAEKNAVLDAYEQWATILRGDELIADHLRPLGESRPLLLGLIALAEPLSRAAPLYRKLCQTLPKLANGWLGGAESLAHFSPILETAPYLAATTDLRAAAEAEAEAKRRADEELRARIAAARSKATAIISNGKHPLVVGHLDALSSLARELVTVDAVRGKKTKFTPLSDADLAAAELALGAPLPNNFKALLLAFGPLKSPYFPKANLAPPKGASLKSAKKAWAIDVEAMKPVLADQGNTTRWFTQDQPLPEKASVTDGTMQIGYSVAQAPLHLLLRGPRAGEVWVDSLDNEAFDVFGPACAQPELLAFLQKSLARVEEEWSHFMY